MTNEPIIVHHASLASGPIFPIILSPYIFELVL